MIVARNGIRCQGRVIDMIITAGENVYSSEVEATEQEIVGFTRERLAHCKCPGTVDIIEALPRTPSGKVLKHTPRAPYWAGRDRQI